MSKKEKLKSPFKYFDSLLQQVKTNKVAYIIFIVLNVAIIGSIVRCVFENRPDGVFVSILAMLLLLIPPFVKKSFRVELPTVLESIAYIFVFCAQILGELNSFYTKFPFWDSMLHTVCGFIFAAFGFCLFDIFNRHKSAKSKFELSPFFVALLAFCFSITIGTLWEFFEYFADALIHTDMQKDFVVDTFGSVYFDPSGLNNNVVIENIEKTIIITKDGLVYEVNGGYLDIGIKDTIKDMFVNFLGALVFSIVGFVYIRSRGKGVVATQFIPVLKGSMESSDDTADVSDQKTENFEKESSDAELTDGTCEEAPSEENAEKCDQDSVKEDNGSDASIKPVTDKIDSAK